MLAGKTWIWFKSQFMQLAAMCIRIIMKICRNSNLSQFPYRCFSCRDQNGYITSGFQQKTGTSQMRCLNLKKKEKEIKSVFQSQSFMGRPILMYQLKSLLNEISWKFKDDTKIYPYDKTLFINLCLKPNLK